MGANFEHIDGVFRNKLRDYSPVAPESIWENIEGTLTANKRAKKFTFYKIAAAVAALAVIGSTFLYINNNATIQPDRTIVAEEGQLENIETNNANQALAKTEDNVASQDAIIEQPAASIESEVIVNVPQKLMAEVIIVEGTPEEVQTTAEKIEKINQLMVKVDYEKSQPEIIDIRKKKIESTLNSLPDLYGTFAYNEVVEPLQNKANKWSMGGEFSPLYSYRHVTETGGANSKEYYNNSENAIMSYTGGVNVQYKAVERLTIQAGVYYTSMGQSFDYMSVYANAAYEMVSEEFKDRFINSYNISNSLGEVSFNSQYIVVDEKLGRVDNLTDSKGAVDVSDPIYSDLDAEIQQSFQYVEVPFILRYKLIDKNIDINLIGGLGANFLVGNDVYLKYGGNKEIIGETEDVNSVNYNGTFGFGIEYPIMNRLNLRLEPSVKYFINEINSNSSIESHPYSIGIYTGINYSF